MKPADLRDFVYGIAQKRVFLSTRTASILSGGDHRDLTGGKTNLQIRGDGKPSAIKAYVVAAGFSKIHGCLYMSCADDPTPLDPIMVVARRPVFAVQWKRRRPDEQNAI
ncbi:class II D-tagatose-bisphosphate aldolase, non-catalytic subunit [Salmonella enterica subsp. enterica]|nr:class II D-tagatose-bisphosphate aldolase, non-catalytic subunit [Salmonella enterica subsp. enterica]